MANLCFVLVLWLAETYVAERHWLTTLITYAPQHWAGMPAVVLLAWSLARRQWMPFVMNVLALVVFAVGLLGLCTPSVVALDYSGYGPPVRVMTWNIHHAAGGTGRIMAQVRKAHPRIVCFQEANDGYWKSDVLPDLRKAFKVWYRAEFREVVTFSRYPILAVRIHRLMPETGRVVLESVLDVDGQRLTVYNTHLNVAIGGRSLKGSGLRGMPEYLRHTIDVRTDQLRELDEIVSTGTKPSLIVGDFNTPPRGSCYRRMIWHRGDLFGQEGGGLGYTYPARHPLMRIDYMFGDGVYPLRCFVPKTTASDHRPFVADLVITLRKR